MVWNLSWYNTVQHGTTQYFALQWNWKQIISVFYTLLRACGRVVNPEFSIGRSVHASQICNDMQTYNV